MKLKFKKDEKRRKKRRRKNKSDIIFIETNEEEEDVDDFLCFSTEHCWTIIINAVYACGGIASGQ